MLNIKIKPEHVSLTAIIALAVVTRLIPHPPNFAPIGGLALFSGSHFKNKLALLIPLAAMVISDIFLGFHSTVPYVYVAFIVISFIGRQLKSSAGVKDLTLAGASSSIVFYLITNFGVWMNGTLYSKSTYGLLQSYIMGLPFLRNTLLADLFYTFAFFYGYRFLSAIITEKLSTTTIKK